MDKQAPVITIDGPSGTGKGTLAAQLAAALGFTWLDSGALYRALAYATLQNNIDITNIDALRRCINAAEIKLEGQQVRCNEVDISAEIRKEGVGMRASQISANPLVRERLLQIQRDQRRLPGLITDGRDMGTVVFPDATVKIFLTADAKVRAKRRFNQLKEKGIDVSLPRIEKELNMRDQADSNRDLSPLKADDDAIIVDTSKQSVDQVFNDVIKIIRPRLTTGF